MLHAVLVTAALVLLSGCVGSAEQQPLAIETGRGAETTYDGLVRMRGSALDDVWAKPDASFAQYSRLLIGDVRMSYKRPPRGSRRTTTEGNYALTRSQAERLEGLLREALTEEIEKSESWGLADAPARDVLLIEPFLMDLVVNVPTDAPPNSTTYTTSTGEVTLVLELRDSLSDEILARVADRREARMPGKGAQQLYWSNPVSNTSAVRSIFRRWARIFMARLDTTARLSAEREAG